MLAVNTVNVTILSTRKAAMKTTSNRNARVIDPTNNARNIEYSYSSHEYKYGSETTYENIPRFFFAYHHPSTLYAQKHIVGTTLMLKSLQCLMNMCSK